MSFDIFSWLQGAQSGGWIPSQLQPVYKGATGLYKQAEQASSAAQTEIREHIIEPATQVIQPAAQETTKWLQGVESGRWIKPSAPAYQQSSYQKSYSDVVSHKMAGFGGLPVQQTYIKQATVPRSEPKGTIDFASAIENTVAWGQGAASGKWVDEGLQVIEKPVVAVVKDFSKAPGETVVSKGLEAAKTVSPGFAIVTPLQQRQLADTLNVGVFHRPASTKLMEPEKQPEYFAGNMALTNPLAYKIQRAFDITTGSDVAREQRNADIHAYNANLLAQPAMIDAQRFHTKFNELVQNKALVGGTYTIDPDTKQKVYDYASYKWAQDAKETDRNVLADLSDTAVKSYGAFNAARTQAETQNAEVAKKTELTTDVLSPYQEQFSKAQEKYWGEPIYGAGDWLKQATPKELKPYVEPVIGVGAGFVKTAPYINPYIFAGTTIIPYLPQHVERLIRSPAMEVHALGKTGESVVTGVGSQLSEAILGRDLSGKQSTRQYENVGSLLALKYGGKFNTAVGKGVEFVSPVGVATGRLSTGLGTESVYRYAYTKPVLSRLGEGGEVVRGGIFSPGTTEASRIKRVGLYEIPSENIQFQPSIGKFVSLEDAKTFYAEQAAKGKQQFIHATNDPVFIESLIRKGSEIIRADQPLFVGTPNAAYAQFMKGGGARGTPALIRVTEAPKTVEEASKFAGSVFNPNLPPGLYPSPKTFTGTGWKGTLQQENIIPAGSKMSVTNIGWITKGGEKIPVIDVKIGEANPITKIGVGIKTLGYKIPTYETPTLFTGHPTELMKKSDIYLRNPLMEPSVSLTSAEKALLRPYAQMIAAEPGAAAGTQVISSAWEAIPAKSGVKFVQREKLGEVLIGRDLSEQALSKIYKIIKDNGGITGGSTGIRATQGRAGFEKTIGDIDVWAPASKVGKIWDEIHKVIAKEIPNIDAAKKTETTAGTFLDMKLGKAERGKYPVGDIARPGAGKPIVGIHSIEEFPVVKKHSVTMESVGGHKVKALDPSYALNLKLSGAMDEAALSQLPGEKATFEGAITAKHAVGAQVISREMASLLYGRDVAKTGMTPSYTKGSALEKLSVDLESLFSEQKGTTRAEIAKYQADVAVNPLELPETKQAKVASHVRTINAEPGSITIPFSRRKAVAIAGAAAAVAVGAPLVSSALDTVFGTRQKDDRDNTIRMMFGAGAVVGSVAYGTAKRPSTRVRSEPVGERVAVEEPVFGRYPTRFAATEYTSGSVKPLARTAYKVPKADIRGTEYPTAYSGSVVEELFGKTSYGKTEYPSEGGKGHGPHTVGYPEVGESIVPTVYPSTTYDILTDYPKPTPTGYPKGSAYPAATVYPTDGAYPKTDYPKGGEYPGTTPYKPITKYPPTTEYPPQKYPPTTKYPPHYPPPEYPPHTPPKTPPTRYPPKIITTPITEIKITGTTEKIDESKKKKRKKKIVTPKHWEYGAGAEPTEVTQFVFGRGSTVTKGGKKTISVIDRLSSGLI